MFTIYLIYLSISLFLLINQDLDELEYQTYLSLRRIDPRLNRLFFDSKQGKIVIRIILFLLSIHLIIPVIFIILFLNVLYFLLGNL